MPTSGVIVRFKDEEFEIRIVTDGSESGHWFKRQEVAVVSMWQGAMLPISAADSRIPPVAVGGVPLAFTPIPKSADDAYMTMLSGAADGGMTAASVEVSGPSPLCR